MVNQLCLMSEVIRTVKGIIKCTVHYLILDLFNIIYIIRTLIKSLSGVILTWLRRIWLWLLCTLHRLSCIGP